MTMPIPYVPVDDRGWRMAMGLRPLDLAHWLEVDERRDQEIALKSTLLAERRDVVVATRPEGFEASAHVLRGDPAKVIMDAALSAQIDLIALATHGKTGMDAFWAGSVTHKICSQSKVPLLLIPVKKS